MCVCVYVHTDVFVLQQLTCRVHTVQGGTPENDLSTDKDVKLHCNQTFCHLVAG